MIQAACDDSVVRVQMSDPLSPESQKFVDDFINRSVSRETSLRDFRLLQRYIRSPCCCLSAAGSHGHAHAHTHSYSAKNQSSPSGSSGGHVADPNTAAGAKEAGNAAYKAVRGPQPTSSTPTAHRRHAPGFSHYRLSLRKGLTFTVTVTLTILWCINYAGVVHIDAQGGTHADPARHTHTLTGAL
jgi:hypothetical protein